MILSALGSGGIAAIIIVAVIVIATALVTVLVILKKKKNVNDVGSSDSLNPTINNSQLLERFTIEKIKPNMVAIVPPTHSALVIKNGSVTDMCSAGEVKLCDSNVTSVRSLVVLYISKTVKLTLRWGTQQHQRFEYVDPKIGKPVSVGAFGVMDIRVSDPRQFYEELVAGSQSFSVEELQNRIRTRVVDDVIREISNTLRDKKVSYVDFNASKYEIQSQVQRELSQRFIGYFGFEVCDFIIENINLPEEQEREIKDIYEEDSIFDREALRDKRRQEIEEREYLASRHQKELAYADADLDDKLYKRSLDREREQEEHERKMRHEDEDRAWARESKLIDNEYDLSGKAIDAYKEVGIAYGGAEKVRANESTQNIGHHCSVCGTAYKPDAKFCPSCGSVIPRESIAVKCPSCSAQVPWGTAFCPNCGTKLCK
ncbi:MAG: SPFH domain-containing protein [Clostridia bacterium]|nr:SPFH domain-containing protein [Clostridia bacterium]